MNRQTLAYDVDIVLCVDGTGSMGPFMDEAKKTMKSFPRDFSEGMAAAKKRLGQLRVKLITFRDLNHDKDAMAEQGFFVLPDEMSQFLKAVDDLHPHGGDDDPESGLDAVVKAMQADWCQTGWKRRHLIVVFTDDQGIPLDKGKHDPGTPGSLAELKKWWEEGAPGITLDPEGKRLILFTPDVYPWVNDLEGWENTDVYWSKAGKGCEEFDMSRIIRRMVKSVAATGKESLQ